MARILIFVALAFLFWFAVRSIGGRRPRDEVRDAGHDRPVDVEPMAQCAWCGTYLPSSQAIVLPDGRDYCGVEHRDAAERARRAASTEARG